jgi:hypothetical protein
MNLGVTPEQLSTLEDETRSMGFDAALVRAPPEIVAWMRAAEDLSDPRFVNMTQEQAREVMIVSRLHEGAQVDKGIVAIGAAAAYVTERDKYAAHKKVMPLWLLGAAAVGGLGTWLLTRK